jgi:hypothetical protein
VKFHEYWDRENKLLELSYKESIRQKEERKMKEEKTCDCHTEEKRQSGECCKQKPNALDEFWTSLGEPDKCKTPTR